jgi:hypothetical protein
MTDNETIRALQQQVFELTLQTRLRDFYEAAKRMSKPGRPINARSDFETEMNSLVEVWRETRNAQLSPLIEILSRVPEEVYQDKISLAEQVAPLAFGAPDMSHPWVRHHHGAFPLNRSFDDTRRTGFGMII